MLRRVRRGLSTRVFPVACSRRRRLVRSSTRRSPSGVPLPRSAGRAGPKTNVLRETPRSRGLESPKTSRAAKARRLKTLKTRRTPESPKLLQGCSSLALGRSLEPRGCARARAAASALRSEDLCAKAWCLARPSSSPKALASRRRFRLRSVISTRPEGLASMSSPSRTLAVARSPEGPLSGLRLAAPCGRLVGPEDLSCCLLWSHGFRFPQRRSEDQGCFQWSRQPLAGRSLGPKTAVAPTRAAGFVTPSARSEDLAPRAPCAADLVSKVGSVRRLCLLPLKSCRPRPVSHSIRRSRCFRAGPITSAGSKLS
jgi:hypothetical protein